MRLKKIFAFSFVFSALLGMAFTLPFSKGTIAVKADDSIPAADFSDEELVSNELNVSAMAASTTGYSTAYDVKFSTGGDAFYDTENMVNILGNDDSLMDFYLNEFAPLTTEEKTQWRRDVAAGLKDTLYFEGYVYSFEMNNGVVYIPRDVSRGTYDYDAVFTVNLTSIASNAFTNNARAVSLYIPKEITSIPSDALINASLLEHIYCEHESKPVGFEDGWNAGAEVTWGEDIYFGSNQKFEHASTINTREVGDPNINFILGYYPKEQLHYPLTLEYDLYLDNVFVGTRTTEYKLGSKSAEYVGVGKGIAGFSTLLTFVIEHEINETVDSESLKLHNIFTAVSSMVAEKQVWKPDFDERFYSPAHKVFEIENNLSDFINIRFSHTTTFNSYVSVVTKIDVVNNGEVYKTLKPNIYEKYENDLKNGSAYLRFRFVGLMNAQYHVYYRNLDKYLAIETPISQFIFGSYKNNNFSVALKYGEIDSEFTINDLKALSLNNISISIDIVKNDVILTKTVATVSFGAVYLLRFEQLSNFNLSLFFIIFAVSYIAAAAICSTALFFYFKKKFRNDEFRRLKPKQFIKKAIIYSLTTLAVCLTILFIVMRLTVFNNSIVVYNPLDIFIVIFGIATIIIIGYYVKNIIVFVKANKQRKSAARLGLQNDQAEDGTK